jgi:Zn-dependent protease
MELGPLVQTIAIYALPVLFAITLHEAAHGYVARHFGDLTAYAQGRISLNPLRHIDPVGTIVVPLLILAMSTVSGFGGFIFGWAKPVPVNFSALRKPRQHMAFVAVAGPGANLAMALAWAIVYHVAPSQSYVWLVAQAGVKVNLVLMFLNLLPILPLDGGRIVASLLPGRAAWQYAKLEPWGLPLLVVLLMTGTLAKVLGPPLVYVYKSLLY